MSLTEQTRSEILRVDSVSKTFGAVRALHDVSLSVSEGECRGIIGANGAGKSTLFRIIARHMSSDSGHVSYRGKSLAHSPAHSLAGMGLAIVFQEALPFQDMTVQENIMVGGHSTLKHGFLAAMLKTPSSRVEESEIRTRSWEIIDRLGLSDIANEHAQELPFGMQRLVQIGRALCGRPRLLLLDEPASGLRFQERNALADVLKTLISEGLTVMLVEHDVRFVFSLAESITVLDLGEVIAQGTPQAIRENQQVIEAYLGTAANA